MSLNEYCKLFPDFALFYHFAKHEKALYFAIVRQNKEDLLQIISQSIIEGGSNNEINRRLKNEMYYFATRVCNFVKVENKQTKIDSKKYYLLKKSQHCDICEKETFQSIYKSFIPGKNVCRICRNRIIRQDKKRNKIMVDQQFVADNLLWPLWQSIDKDYKREYAKEIWQQFFTVVKSSTFTRDLKTFLSKFTKKIPSELNKKSSELIMTVLNAGEDEQILQWLREETTYMVMLIRIKNQERKDLYNENDNN